MSDILNLTGKLFGVGLGPGDPELMTLKAVRAIQAAHVVAFPSARHGQSNARSIAALEIRSDHIELRMIYPVTTELTDHPGGYEGAMTAFYDDMAAQIAAHLESGRDVAILCEGDPFFYGSYMYLHDRLAHRFTTEVIPGVASIMGAASRLGTPLVRRNTELVILPATLSEEELIARLNPNSAFAIIKMGRNFAKVKSALTRAGLLDRALFIQKATMANEQILKLEDVDPLNVAYFSLVLVPDSWETPASEPTVAPGRVTVIGLGPGAQGWITPETTQALAEATDLVGYHTYLNRVPVRHEQTRHGSDNKVELDRARHALTLAEAGRRVCVVSSGDPGIFAMASAVLEAVEHGPASWRALDVRILPGLSAMQAAASRAGAPLGHDFCVISLSDRLKPWETIVERLRAAASADFALALYNPVSSERTWQLEEARAVLAEYRTPETPVVLARAVGRSDERITLTNLGSFDPAHVDMQTLVLVGSSTTRSFALSDGRSMIYTPRTYKREEA